jgi:ribose transport system substrate-binding protein
MTADTSTRPRNVHLIPYLIVIALLIGMGIYFYTTALQPRPHLAMVTASSGPYWDLIIRGAKDAADKYNSQLEIITPPSDLSAQTDALRGLIGKGYAGVAVSPNDPVRQADVLSDIGADSKLVTFDSDSPVSNRICFIGTDNYDAGRTAAQHIRDVVPSGEVIIAIGSLEKQNGQQRRQGVIDELLDRSFEPQRPMDPVDASLKSEKYTIVATLVDGIDAAKAEQMATQAMKDHPNVKGFIGLFAYNTPAILKALQTTGNLGKVQVVGFDANEETLEGIEKGSVYATMLQDPYYIGMESVRILAEAVRGNRRAVPLFQQYNLACDPVTKNNVDYVREQIAARLAGKPGPMRPAPSSARPAATSQTTEE